MVDSALLLVLLHTVIHCDVVLLRVCPAMIRVRACALLRWRGLMRARSAAYARNDDAPGN